ncbi:MAG: SCO family protein [Acidobacteria bacterium]|nr:SCO family protein [Acidobacteriota bacterium]
MLPRLFISLSLATVTLRASGIGKVPQGTEVPPQLKEVGIEQKIGAQIPLDSAFLNEKGQPVTIRELVSKRPVILAPVYYECPMLCSMILNGTLRSLRALKLNAGSDFDVVALSFDPEETPALAERKKFEYTERYNRPGTEVGWHFLTGSIADIKKVTDAAGFRYKRDAASGQWAHASAIMVVTPDGRLARYFYGVEYSARDLRLAIVEAAQGKVGSVVDQILLYCFHYEASTGKYSLAVMNVLRAGGILTVLGFLAFVYTSYRDNNKRGKQGNHVEFSSVS